MTLMNSYLVSTILLGTILILSAGTFSLESNPTCLLLFLLSVELCHYSSFIKTFATIFCASLLLGLLTVLPYENKTKGMTRHTFWDTLNKIMITQKRKSEYN